MTPIVAATCSVDARAGRRASGRQASGRGRNTWQAGGARTAHGVGLRHAQQAVEVASMHSMHVGLTHTWDTVLFCGVWCFR